MAHVQASGSGRGTTNLTTSWEPVDRHYAITLTSGIFDLIPVIGVLAGNASLGRSATWVAGTPTVVWV